MNIRKSFGGIAWALLGGVVIWACATLSTSRREVWDARSYWMFFYPVSIIVSAIIAYRYPRRPVLASLVLFEVQFVCGGIKAGELGNLWPISIVLFAIVSIPAMGAAWFAAGRSPYGEAGEKGGN